MNLLVVLLAECGTVAAGFGLAALLLPARPVSRVELAGLALALGSGAISLLLFVLGSFLQGTPLIATVGLCALALGALGVIRTRGRECAVLPGSGCFVALLLPLLFLIGWQSGNHPLTADGLFNFEIRAQLAGLHGGRLPLHFFSDVSRTWMHPAYPLFLPMNQAWIYLCLGGPHQGLAQLLTVHFAAAVACLLYAGVSRLTGESWRAVLAVALLFSLPAATVTPGGVTSLWADFPLALIFLAALIYLIEFGKSGHAVALFGAFLALLPWVKREGTVLAAVLVATAVWIAWKRGEVRRLIPALVPLLIVTLGWRAFLARVQVSADHDFLPVSFATAVPNLDRIPFILTALGRELLAWERWNLLWPLAIVAFIRIARQPALAPWRSLAPIVSTLVLVYASIYVFSAWTSLPLHLVTSLPRLLLPVAMPALLAVAVAVPSARAKQTAGHTPAGVGATSAS